MFRNVLAVSVIEVSFMAAQEAPTVSQHFKPGDPIHYYVRFDGNPELDAISIYFEHQGAAKKEQVSLASGFRLGGMRKMSSGLYELNGTIPNNVPTGTFQLMEVSANHSPVARSYSSGRDFSDKITIEIVNEAGYEFPPIKSITPSPPK